MTGHSSLQMFPLLLSLLQHLLQAELLLLELLQEKHLLLLLLLQLLLLENREEGTINLFLMLV